MSKKLRDNFDVRIKQPIDKREVCNNKEDIDRPYEGLITLQLSDGKRYEYRSNAWKEYFTNGGGNDIINVIEYGVKTDGTNQTAKIQELLNTYSKLYFPKGTYKFDSVLIPSTVKEIKGCGDETIFTNFTTPLETSHLKFDSLIDAYVHDFNVNNDNVANPNATHIELAMLSNCVIENIRIPNTAYFGINAHDCNTTTVKNCSFINWKQCGIYFAGTNSKNNIISHNVVTGTGNQHAIQCNQGKGNTISDNIVTGAGQFGCNLYLESNSVIKNNKISNTTKEGINVQDSNLCSIIGNDVKWSTPINSTDFGISLWGSDISNTVNNCIVTDNIVAYPAKSGIALAENCHHNLISNNIIINPNQINEAWGSGILVYGDTLAIAPTYNTISNNRIINNEATSYLKYGVSEQTQPTVSKSDYNIFKFNDSYGAIKSCILAGYKSLADSNTPDAWTDFTPVLSTSVGSMGSHSILKGEYKVEGKKCYFYFQVRINDAGTGSGYSIINLPFEQNNNPFARFIIIGSESVTGKSLKINVVNNKLNFTSYDNTYLGGVNYIYTIQGYYEINNM